MEMDVGGYWDTSDKIVDISKTFLGKNIFGTQLFEHFAEKLKTRFYRIEEEHYGPFYLSPAVYARRYDVILNLNDPRFRINQDGHAIHVWRKEWEELLTKWNLTND